jgi:hypothetical protein
MKAKRVDTWSATIKDRPGALAAKFKTLAAAGVDLEFVVARRSPEKRGSGVVFVTPIKGPKQCGVAGAIGFKKTKSLHNVRVEGSNKRGQGARLTQALADEGLNLRGLSAAAIGDRFVCHIAVDTETDANKVVRILSRL